MNQSAKYLGRRSFSSKGTHRQTHTQPTECSTWTTKVVGNKCNDIPVYRLGQRKWKTRMAERWLNSDNIFSVTDIRTDYDSRTCLATVRRNGTGSVFLTRDPTRPDPVVKQILDNGLPQYQLPKQLPSISRLSESVLFTARRYASAVLAVVVCPSVCPSVCHKPVLYRNGNT